MRLKQMTALLMVAALTVTGIYIPGNATDVYAKEIEITDSKVDNTEGTTLFVHSAQEVISALNGQSVSADCIRIEMNTPYTGAKDATYEINSGDLDLTTGIILPENKDITLDMCGFDISVSDNVVQNTDNHLKITIPKSTKLTIYSEGNARLPFELENKGTLSVTGQVMVQPLYGNGILNTGTANIEDSTSINFSKIKEDRADRAPVHNVSGTVFINTDNDIFTNEIQSLNSSSIINENGTMTIENGIIGEKSLSGNTIINKGISALLEIRGGTQNSNVISSKKECAVLNDGGKVTIVDGITMDDSLHGSPVSIIGSKVGILNYNGGHLDMYSGNVMGGPDNDCVAISTTPYSYNGLMGTLSEGSVRIVDGSVMSIGDNSVGIAFGERLPVVLGGMIVGTYSAIARYSSQGTRDTEVKHYAFLNSKNETVGAYVPEKDGVAAYALKEIYNGMNSYYTGKDYRNGVTVKTFAELKEALKEGGNIRFQGNFEIEEPLTFTKDTTLYTDYYMLSMKDAGASLTINEGVTVNFESEKTDYFMHFEKTPAGGAGIINKGTLSMNNVLIGDMRGNITTSEMIRNSGVLTVNNTTLNCAHGGVSENSPSIIIHNESAGKALIQGNTMIQVVGAGTYGIGIYNSGELHLDTASMPTNVLTGTKSGIALWNKGTAEMKGYTRISSTGTNSIGLKNQGNFIMQDGTIEATWKSSSTNFSYAVVYDEEHYPTFVQGYVIGSLSSQSKVPGDSTKGTAVACVTDWSNLTTTKGSYKNLKGELFSGENSSLIINAIPRMDATVESQYDYLLLEQGEQISDCASNLFEIENKYMVSSNVVMSSSSENVVRVTRDGSGKWVAKAEGIGMAMLRMELEESGISDYIRVEVVKDRNKLIAENYQGSLPENNIVYNAYQKYTTIPLEWHLKDSYDITAADSDLDIINYTFKPERVLLESQDPDFKNYFTDDIQISFDDKTKKYYFKLRATSHSSEEYNYLANHEIKGFSDITAKLKVEINGKTEVFDIGTFDIMIDSTIPKFEYNTITLNSAFKKEFSYNSIYGNTVFPSDADIDDYAKTANVKVVGIACPNGFGTTSITAPVTPTVDRLSYTGAPKKANYSIPVTVQSAMYNGYFETKLPVMVINEKPKADVVTKKIVVAKSTADTADIPMQITSKTEAGVVSVSKVEIVDKNCSFSIANASLDGANGVYSDGKKYIHDLSTSFYLQPRKTLTKPETITLKFTYENARGNYKGNGTYANMTEPGEYTTTTTVTIVPKDISKASMKQTNKPVMIATAQNKKSGVTAHDSTTLEFATTPSNYLGGYFVVTGLNGTVLTDVSANAVQGRGAGKYSVDLYATDSSKAGKKMFSIYWYDKDGKQLGSPLKAWVVFQKEVELKFADKTVVMDINRERTFNKSGYETTRQLMAAKLKYTASGDWHFMESRDYKFEIVGDAKGNALIRPSATALETGMILPGNSYSVKILCYNRYGESKMETITVNVKSISDIKVKASGATIYKEAPYEQSFISMETSKPAYGLYITKVEIADDKTPFEMKATQRTGLSYVTQNMRYGQESLWSVAFKNNAYNKTLVGKQTVNLKVTYQNGQTATTKTTILVK